MQSSVVGGNEDKKSVNEGALARMDLFSVELNRGTVRILTLSLLPPSNPPSNPPRIFSIFSMLFFLCPPSSSFLLLLLPPYSFLLPTLSPLFFFQLKVKGLDSISLRVMLRPGRDSKLVSLSKKLCPTQLLTGMASKRKIKQFK